MGCKIPRWSLTELKNHFSQKLNTILSKTSTWAGTHLERRYLTLASIGTIVLTPPQMQKASRIVGASLVHELLVATLPPSPAVRLRLPDHLQGQLRLQNTVPYQRKRCRLWGSADYCTNLQRKMTQSSLCLKTLSSKSWKPATTAGYSPLSQESLV
jgi:hypothetical protein